jgi:hypothetical protein
MGLRNEPKSVRTGTYANSITVEKDADYEFSVLPIGN